MTYKGGCHCGRIAFEVDGELDKVVQCNCSICTKRGYLLWMRPRDELRLATPEADLATYTLDHLAYTLQPPVVAAIVDYEGGGRLSCELTDVDPKEVAIGNELEMTFRRLYTGQGVHNYFWKARPKR